jgi:hypothetical protein
MIAGARLLLGVAAAVAVSTSGTATSAPQPPQLQQPPQRVAARLVPSTMPPARPSVRGAFKASLQLLPEGAILTWKLVLRGTHGAVSAAIALGRPPQVGPTLVALCSTCGRSRTRSSFVPPPLVDAMLHGGAYITIATRRQPLGVARGQIEVLR